MSGQSQNGSTSLSLLGGRTLTFDLDEAKRSTSLFNGKGVMQSVTQSSLQLKAKAKNGGRTQYLGNFGRRALGSDVGDNLGNSLMGGASASIANPTKLAQMTAPMTDEASYTIIDASNQWSQVGKSQAFLERPITRKEIVRLEKRFETAIRYSKMAALEAPSLKMNPVFERDVVNMRQSVLELYQQEAAKHRTQQRSLTQAMIAQKWTDIVFSEISNSIAIGCLENGRLLSKIRHHYGEVFGLVKGVHHFTLGELSKAEAQIKHLQSELMRLTAVIDNAEGNFRTREQQAVNRIRTLKDEELDSTKSEMRELATQVGTLKYTLTTLNGIFKGMRQDGDLLREADLRESNVRMQAILKEQAGKLKLLGKLEQDYESAKQTMAQQASEIEDLRAQLDTTKTELDQQRGLAQQLMQSEGQRLQGMESMLKSVEVSGEHPDAAQKKLEKMVHDNMAGKPGSNVLCVRCRKTMEESRQLDELENTLGEKMKRLPCAAFRILLPNLLGFRPERTTNWTLRCCRAILMAKLRQDALCSRSGARRARMPEFVFAWYAPRGEFRTKRARDEAMAEADENRWGLYYGVKKLQKRMPEAKTFFELLDETHGEDDLSFYLYNLQTLRSVARAELNWDESITRAGDYQTMLRLAEKISHDDDQQLRQIQWVSQETSMYLVEQTMAKSTESERDKVIMRILNKCLPARGRLIGMDDYDSEDDDNEDSTKKAADISVVIAMLMEEYREEQATRKASVRLMFQTAMAKIAAEATEQLKNADPTDKEAVKKSSTLDLQQFSAMVHTLNKTSQLSDVTYMYRESFETGKAQGVSLASFLDVAERNQFFTACLRVPTYYGAAAVDGMTNKQIEELRDVVYRHYRLFQECMEHYSQRLNPVQVSQMQRLLGLVEAEVDLSKKGIIGVDGRRLLCAYRRLLDFLSARRMEMLEEDGEPIGLYAVKKVEVEISNTEALLASFVQEGEDMTLDAQLRAIMTRVAAGRIKRRWQERQEEHPLTLGMRKEMSSDYVTGMRALKGISRSRRHVRKSQWLMFAIYEIIGALHVDLARHSSAMAEAERTHQPLPDYSAPNLCHFIHNFFLKRFGNFSLSELHLHDLFTTMKSRIKENGLIQAFMNLVSEGGPMKAAEFGDKHATEFFLKAISACRDRPEDIEAKMKRFGIPEPPLLPPYDSITKTAWIDIDRADDACRRLFPDRAVHMPLIQRLKTFVKDQRVDFGKLVWLFMEKWLSEVRRRMRAMRGFLQGLDPSGNSDVRSFMSTYHDFYEAISSTGLAKNRSDLFKINLYREAIKIAVKDTGSLMATPSSTAMNALVLACRTQGLVTWKTSVSTPHVPDMLAVRSQLLKLSWLPFNDSVNYSLSKVEQEAVKFGLNADGVRKMRQDLKALNEQIRLLPVEAPKTERPKDETNAKRVQIENAWGLFRALMASLSSAMLACKLGHIIPDHLIAETAGGIEEFFKEIMAASAAAEAARKAALQN